MILAKDRQVEADDAFVVGAEIGNWIGGVERGSRAGEHFDKRSPHDGELLARVARSRAADVADAVSAASAAAEGWARTPGVKRGEILHAVVAGMVEHRGALARIVALETGKSPKDALGETDGAIALGRFMAGEGQRLFGRTMPSGAPDRQTMTIRQPVGVAGLVIAANTPIANVAWKVFPALVCGNAAVLKGAEDTPVTAWLFGKIARAAGLPPGVLNIVQGFGAEAGGPLVADPRIGVVSFTGSTQVGRVIQQVVGERLARVSLELGGKNALLVCDDTDLTSAVRWAALSAFSNAGQRCAAAGRIIVMAKVHDEFRRRLLEKIDSMRVGPTDEDDFGPVINQRAIERITSAIAAARKRGAVVVRGGERLTDRAHAKGYYLGPTLLEGAHPDDEISTTELFGPVACLYRVTDFAEGLALANRSPYGLTACVHTGSIHRALEFAYKVEAGVVMVNAGTFGSEPHMPFGGVKQSGNGTREPGTEALDVYSNLKNVVLNFDPARV